jgi:hypothetical protein
MNPATREAKRALIKTLNEATLDPNTGEQNVPRTPPSRPDDLTIPFQRSSSHPRPCIWSPSSTFCAKTSRSRLRTATLRLRVPSLAKSGGVRPIARFPPKSRPTLTTYFLALPSW